MCGRSRCALAPEQVEQAAGVRRERWVDRERYRPSYNVSPGAWTPILRLDEHNASQLQTVRWGLVPSFTKPGEKPDFYKMFNARSETVSEKPIFSRLLKRQRCVVLLEGFYEWKTDAGGKKQPYYCYFGEGSVMKMAGLYDVWAGGSDGPLTTYTILTTDAAPRLTWLHNRMPVILPDDAAVTTWLGSSSKPLSTADGSSPQQQQQQQDEEGEDLQQGVEVSDSAEHVHEGKVESGVKGQEVFSLKVLEQLCQPFNGDSLVWHPVTPAMSKPSYDNPDASKDVRTKKGSISTFFSAGGKQPTAPAAAAAVPKRSPAKDTDAASGGKDVAEHGVKTKRAAAAEGEEKGEQQQQQKGKLTKQEQQHDHHQKSPQQQQKCQQQQKVTKGTISNFFKPVTSPAKQQQQQQQSVDSAVRNPDEEPGPSAEDNAVARKLVEQERGTKRPSGDSKMGTHSKKARGRAA